ncbi:MAG: hypothetical protein KAJ59_04820 [Thermodesulfovibrionia bacterium]|nr:hypothetical protein [Thermodesulfovibrionia bacterium]
MTFSAISSECIACSDIGKVLIIKIKETTKTRATTIISTISTALPGDVTMSSNQK